MTSLAQQFSVCHTGPLFCVCHELIQQSARLFSTRWQGRWQTEARWRDNCKPGNLSLHAKTDNYGTFWGHKMKGKPTIGPLKKDDGTLTSNCVDMATLLADALAPGILHSTLDSPKGTPRLWQLFEHCKPHSRRCFTLIVVSLTCIVCKILEKMIKARIWKHLEQCSLIRDSQPGFRSGR